MYYIYKPFMFWWVDGVDHCAPALLLRSESPKTGSLPAFRCTACSAAKSYDNWGLNCIAIPVAQGLQKIYGDMKSV